MINILVVEDEVYARQSLVKQLHEYDKDKTFNVIEASNGQEALDIFNQQTLDLVITDIRMPQIDGLELLHRIKDKDEKVHIIVVSAYSDFDYCQRALVDGTDNYLLKPVEDEKLKECLDKFLNKNMIQKRENIAIGRDIISEYIRQILDNEKENELNTVAENMFRIFFPSYQFIVICFYKNVRLDQEALFAKIDSVFANGAWTSFRIIKITKQRWGMVVNADEDSSFIPRKLAYVLKKDGYTVDIGVSGRHKKPEEILISFDEAIEAAKCRFNYTEEIVYYDKISNAKYNTYRLSPDMGMRITKTLKAKLPSQYKEAVISIFNDISLNAPIRSDSLELVFSQIVLMMQDTFVDLDISALHIQKNILDFEKIGDIENYLINIGENFCRFSNQKQDNDVINQIVLYATQHYDSNITIKDIAENILFMNPTYVSHLFATKYGENFTSWLRELRMKRAVELMESGKLSVGSVASMTGYNDVSLFIKTFKQETGKTPKKYMESIRNNMK